ncbi:hypothetical protein KY366_08825, partial [Candidatus Woesearchaeota archaeon]|nr:hypothetical protein [Candidatus Woesearchaeota archaeon]
AVLVTPAAGYIEVYRNGTLINNGNNEISNYSQYNIPGIYNITALYSETQNYTSSYETHLITVEDTNAPNITIITPLNSDILGWTILLRANITDYNLADVWYEIRNGTIDGPVIDSGDMDNLSGNLFNSTLHTNETWPYNTGSLNSTNLTFVVYANDSSGNTRNASTYWELDNTMPSIQYITPPQTGSFYNSNFSLEIFIANSRLNYSSYNITNETGSLIQGNSINLSNSTFTWKDKVNVSSLAQGNYTITSYTRDSAGNNNTKQAWFYVDTLSPDISSGWELPTPSNNTYTRQQLHTFNFTCSEQFIDSVWIDINSTINSSPFSQGTSYWWSLVLGQGTYQYTAYCSDRAGNTNNTETRVINIDLTAPAWGSNRTYPASPATYAAGQSYQFNVTWSDNYNLRSVLFEHNFTGTMANYTASNISGEFYYEYSSLAAGSYAWRSYANDTSGNMDPTDRWTYVVEKAEPVVEMLINGTGAGFRENVTFDANLTCRADTGGILNLSQDGATLNYGAGQIANITTYTELGSYSVNCSFEGDENYTAASEGYYVYAVDEMPPAASLNSPKAGYYNDSSEPYNITFSCSASDNYGLANISLWLTNSSTQGFSLNQSATITGTANSSSWTLSLNNGNYLWSCLAYDAEGNPDSGENRSVSINYSGADSEAPAWSFNRTYPESHSAYYPGRAYQFNVTWNDAGVGLDTVIIEHNFTGTMANYTASNMSGEFYYEYSSLAAGSYVWRSYANDTYGNMNLTNQWAYIVQKAAPSCGLLFNLSSPQDYGTAINASCSCTGEAGAVLYRNGSDVTSQENNKGIMHAAGYYSYNCTSAASQNYTSAVNASGYTINKATLSLNLTAEPGWNTTYGTQTTVNCNSNTEQVTPQLYRNNTNIAIPYTGTLAAGRYYYVCNSSASQNYTSGTESRSLNISKAGSEINLSLNGYEGNISVDEGEYVSINATLITPAYGYILLYNNGTLINNGLSPISNRTELNRTGQYNITALYSGTQNYSSSIKTLLIEVESPSSDTGQPSGGGGGGGSSGGKAEQIREGEFRKGRITFKGRVKEKLRFVFDGKSITVGIEEIGHNSARILIQPGFAVRTMSVGDSGSYDLNSDGEKDIKVTLDKLSESTAELAIYLLSYREEPKKQAGGDVKKEKKEEEEESLDEDLSVSEGEQTIEEEGYASDRITGLAVADAEIDRKNLLLNMLIAMLPLIILTLLGARMYRITTVETGKTATMNEKTGYILSIEEKISLKEEKIREIEEKIEKKLDEIKNAGKPRFFSGGYVRGLAIGTILALSAYIIFFVL